MHSASPSHYMLYRVDTSAQITLSNSEWQIYLLKMLDFRALACAISGANLGIPNISLLESQRSNTEIVVAIYLSNILRESATPMSLSDHLVTLICSNWYIFTLTTSVSVGHASLAWDVREGNPHLACWNFMAAMTIISIVPYTLVFMSTASKIFTSRNEEAMITKGEEEFSKVLEYCLNSIRVVLVFLGMMMGFCAAVCL